MMYLKLTSILGSTCYVNMESIVYIGKDEKGITTLWNKYLEGFGAKVTETPDEIYELMKPKYGFSAQIFETKNNG